MRASCRTRARGQVVDSGDEARARAYCAMRGPALPRMELWTAHLEHLAALDQLLLTDEDAPVSKFKEAFERRIDKAIIEVGVMHADDVLHPIGVRKFKKMKDTAT